MATPIPVAKPPASGLGGIIAFCVLLLLTGSEYYLLTTRDEARQPHRTVSAQPTAVPTLPGKTKATSAAKRQIGARKSAAKQLKSEQQVGAKPATAPPGQALDLSHVLGGSGPSGGPKLLEQVMTQADQWEAMGAGVAVRTLLILACVGLLFLQKPPTPKVGASRRRARNPKTIEQPLLYIYVLLFFGSVFMLGVGSARGDVLSYGYPGAGAFLVSVAFVGGFLRASTIPVEGPIMPEKLKRPGRYTIVLPAQGNRYVNVVNPDRGTLVLGGAGAGKTYSIGEPMLEQFLQQGRCGLIYDFKFPVLAGAAQKALLYAQPAHTKLLKEYQENLKENNRNKDGDIEGLRKPIRHRVINFVDMERTEKVNPLRPQDMPTTAYAMEYAETILTNLSSAGAKGGDEFFGPSAQAYLTGIIWYYRNNYPALCTIPHVVQTALYKDFTHVLHMLSEDEVCADLVQSLITAVRQGSEKQISGVVSTLQVKVARLATAEIAWVLAPDEDPALGEEAEGFSLNLNDPDNPTLLTIGNDPTLAKTFAPVISCVVAVALKLMNQQHKHPSFVLVDEGATIYVPGLEMIPATARSNRVAMLYMTQDVAQLIDAYGKDKTQVLISNLNNQFIGKVNSLETARLVQDMIGTIDTEVVSVNTGQSMGTNGSSSKGQNVSIQEKKVFRAQDAYTLRQGEFVGQTVETDPNNFFLAQFEREVEPGNFPIAEFAFFAAERGIVDDRTRAAYTQMLQADSQRSAEQLRRTAEARRQRMAARQGQVAVVRQQVEAKQPRRKGQRLALVGEGDATQPTHINLENQVSQATQVAQIKEESQASQATQPTQIKEEGQTSQVNQATQISEEPDWAWEEKLQHDSFSVQPPQYEPSLAEQVQLDALANQARHARKRVQLTPNAAAEPAPDTPGEPLSEAEAQRRSQRAKEREAQRTTRTEEKRDQSVLADTVEANYKRIRREVETAILKSGENSLSKAGLEKKALEAKMAATQKAENPYK